MANEGMSTGTKVVLAGAVGAAVTNGLVWTVGAGAPWWGIIVANTAGILVPAIAAYLQAKAAERDD